jgi:hypothetical protein
MPAFLNDISQFGYTPVAESVNTEFHERSETYCGEHRRRGGLADGSLGVLLLSW